MPSSTFQTLEGAQGKLSCPGPSTVGPSRGGEGGVSCGLLWVLDGLGLPDPAVALTGGCPVTSKVFPGWMRAVMALRESGHAFLGWDPHRQPLTYTS